MKILQHCIYVRFLSLRLSDEDSNGDILGTHLALDDGGFTVMLDYLLSGFDSNPAKYD